MFTTLQAYQEKILPIFTQRLEQFVKSLFIGEYQELENIFSYHLGLDQPIENQGKRLRPFLLLLCVEGGGGIWDRAIPAAISVELIHNFSLIHDDIEDDGALRRGREAVWKKWGLPQGLNAGDAMYAAAFLAMQRLNIENHPEICISAIRILSDTCLLLTQGQYLDIDFERRGIVHESTYLQMVQGKTAALIAGCTRLGALIAGLPDEQQALYGKFGNAIGLAFQIYDDWMGVWGDPSLTGKSTTSDFLEKKKTLPVILGNELNQRFREAWDSGISNSEEGAEMAALLTAVGVEEKIMMKCERWTNKSVEYLDKMDCSSKIKKVLSSYANELLIRQK